MFKHILLALIISLSIYTPAIAGDKQVERFFENNVGLVDRYSKIAAPKNSASDIQNIMFDDRGQLSKRNGYTKNNAAFLGITSTGAVVGMGYQGGSSGYFAVVVGSQVFRTGNTFSGTYTNVTSTISLTNSSNNLVTFTQYNSLLVGCNESDPPFKVASSGNAFKLIGVSTVAKTCAGFGNYLVLGNTKEGTTDYPNRIRWSDINNPDSWPANNYIDVEPEDADGIIAVVQYQASLYIFKKRSIHQLIITGLDGAEAFVVRPIARGIGAYAKNSVKVLDTSGIIFLGQNGIYTFDGSSIELISDNIQRTVDDLARNRYAYSVGAIYRPKNQYWLAVSTATLNQKVLIYDYVQNSWSIYTGINASAIASAEDSNGNQILLTGSNTGNVHKQDVESENDNPDGVETAINAFYTTQDLYFGAPELDKTFRYLYVFTIVNTTTTVTVQSAYNFESGYVDSFSFQLEEEGELWDTAVWNSATWPQSANRVFRVRLDRTGRAMRLKFSNNTTDQLLGILGWTIVYELQDWKE